MIHLHRSTDFAPLAGNLGLLHAGSYAFVRIKEQPGPKRGSSGLEPSFRRRVSVQNIIIASGKVYQRRTIRRLLVAIGPVAIGVCRFFEVD
jgi:hypothetical protein